MREVELQPIEIPASGLMDVELVAEYLGCKVDAVRYLHRVRELKPRRKIGKRWKFHIDDVRKYIDGDL